MKQKYKIARITWVDSCAAQGWHNIRSSEIGIGEVTSVGFIVHEDKKAVVLTTSVSPTNGHVLDALSIPRGAIVKIVRLQG